jgi:hypothetical protein
MRRVPMLCGLAFAALATTFLFSSGAAFARHSAASAALADASSTATQIHNQAHQAVTEAGAGAVVHDFVTVTGQQANPPSGDVTLEFFTNDTCTAGAAATSGPVALNGAGQADATGFPQGPLTAGFYSFRATYAGDPTYSGSVGACESLRVVDANIQLTPPNATNQVGTNHVLTCHINVNDGTGFVPAPAGTTCTVAVISGPGVPVGQTCATVGTTGDCQVTISSGQTGTSVIFAATTVGVSGVSLTRMTGDGNPGDSANAQKQWVNARILIAPNGTNAVGQPHTFTVTVEADTGAGFQPVSNVPCNVTLTPANGASPVPAGPFNLVTNGAGQCQVTFTSSTPGTVTGSASSTVTIDGVVMNVSTDGQAPNSGPAVKTFVSESAAILIAPNGTNEVGQPHTFTVTVLKDSGSGLAPVGAGEPCNVTLTPTNGASPIPAGPFNLQTNANGQCQVTFTSPTGGTVTGNASSTVLVNGVPTTVSTDGQAPNSGSAVKTYVDANIQLTPSNSTNQVGNNHVLTCHINVNDGSGGFTNAPAGTTCTGSLTGPGVFIGSNQCTTVGTTGECQLAISSNATGQTTVHATTTLSVGGVTLTRATGDSHAGDSGDAQKQWVNARILIAPNATNEVGQPHTFTVTVEADTGAGFQPVAGVPCNVTLTPANGASPVPSGPFNLQTNANGQCQVTFTSSTAGTVTGNASSTVTIGGVVMNVSTDGQAPSSGPAVKTFVDANIQLTPPSGTNPTGTNHVLTCHINVNDGSGGFTNAPAGTTCTGSLTGPGAFVGSNQCTTVGTTGDCQLTITSGSAGQTTVRVTSTLSVGGVTLTRTTGDAHVGDSPDATKDWFMPNPVVTVEKVCPNGKQSDGDRFGVLLNGTPTGDVLDCGGSATVTVSPGAAYTIREHAASPTTNLANYSVTYSAGCGGSLPAGGAATCTITNSRLPARSQELTPGYWKNHSAQTTALLPVLLGSFVVGNLQTANAVFNAMNCGNSKDANAFACLAGQLLAAKLNVKNGASNCINPIINQADALLTAVGYAGPAQPLGSTPTAAQRDAALQLQAALDEYNNGKGC